MLRCYHFYVLAACAALFALSEETDVESVSTAKEEEEDPEEIAKLQAQVDELRALKKQKENARTLSEIDHLQELLGNLGALEKASKKAEKREISSQEISQVEKMITAFKKDKMTEDLDLSGPIEEDELYACALLSTRRFCRIAPTKTTTTSTTGILSIGDDSDDSCELLKDFANGKKTDGSSFSVGAAATAKSAVFRGIVVCLKELGVDGLADFRDSGGFDIKSDRELSRAMSDQAQGKKTASMWTGEVFKLGFNKLRWAQLRKIVSRHFAPPLLEALSATVPSEDATTKEEL